MLQKFGDIVTVGIYIDTQKGSKTDKKCLYCKIIAKHYQSLCQWHTIPPILHTTNDRPHDGNRDRHFRYQRNSSYYTNFGLRGSQASTATHGYPCKCEKFCSSRT